MRTALQSMTGFARREGTSGRWRWAWELRSVNGKGLDIRLRLPAGYEHLETDIRTQAAEKLTRGNVQISLSLSTTDTRFTAVVNQNVLDTVLTLRTQLNGIIDPSPLHLDTLLSIRGLVDFQETEDSEDMLAARDADLRAGFDAALHDLWEARQQEGQALDQVLQTQITTIASLTDVIEGDPSLSPAEIALKLASQIALLSDHGTSLDRDRLHMEAALLATKADLREEIDRLKAHVSAVRALLEKGGPVGRRLDFLAQEFNREANTICSKSNAVAVTNAGIELKVVIDQFREQVQNLE